MKIKLFIVVLVSLGLVISCTSQKIVVNKKIITETNEPMLYGRITPEALKTEDFSWYTEGYDSYIPERGIIKRLRNQIRFYNIEIFMGTWCSDTHEQLPKFMKILDELNFPKGRLSIYGLNKKKESFYGEQAQKAIYKVPTFIIYKGTRAVGRIEESPKISLEQDLYKIITGKDYIN